VAICLSRTVTAFPILKLRLTAFDERHDQSPCRFIVAPRLQYLGDPTHVIFRAKVQDARFIGDHMGGVQITLTDLRTGAVLANGLTQGGTGDTLRIMKAPRTRGMPVADPSAAGFEAVSKGPSKP
jgi:hypothetical protein